MIKPAMPKCLTNWINQLSLEDLNKVWEYINEVDDAPFNIICEISHRVAKLEGLDHKIY